LSDTRTTEKQQSSVTADREILALAPSPIRLLWEKAPLSALLLAPRDSNTPAVIVDCNAMACAMYGYTRVELIGRNIDLIEFRPRSEKDIGNWLQALHQHGRLESHSQHKRKDGTAFPVENFDSLIAIDGRELVLRMELDATARLATEDAMRQEHNFIRALLNTTPDYVYFKDRASRFLMVSRAVAKNAGLDDPTKIIGTTDFDYSSPTHARKAFEDEERIMKTGQPIVDALEKETLDVRHSLKIKEYLSELII